MKTGPGGRHRRSVALPQQSEASHAAPAPPESAEESTVSLLERLAATQTTATPSVQAPAPGTRAKDPNLRGCGALARQVSGVVASLLILVELDGWAGAGWRLA